MSDINTEWKELLPKIGNLISDINMENYQINVKLKELQEKEEHQVKLQAQIDEAYNKGIQDLYDACRFLAEPVLDLRPIFGSMYIEKIVLNYSPQEIIDKIKQWKVEKDKKEQELHVGDEVTTDNGFVGIIIDVGDNDGIVWVSYRITPEARGLDSCWVSKIKCKKTGRHFDSIPFDYNPEKGD